MTPRFRFWALGIIAMPLLAAGCRCGHERAVSDREVGARAGSPTDAVMGQRKDESDVETWEPSLYLIPESALEVVDEFEVSTPPRSAADELWVVARGEKPAPADHMARLGAAEGKAMGRERQGMIPLSITARIAGFVASIEVQHRLSNATSDTADFIYDLPLPDDASVRDFTVTVGPRTIRGVIRAREEALSIYRLAKQRGLVASLIDLEEETSLRNAIDNVPPGQTMELRFSYCTVLPYLDNAFELRIPLGITATMSPSSAIDQAGAAGTSRGTPIDMRVELDMGMPLLDVRSATHVVAVDYPAPDSAKIRVTGPITTGDPAFVLRCRVAGPEIATAVFSRHDPKGSYVSVFMVPPATTEMLRRRPLELLLLLDCSESMRGMNFFVAKQMMESGLAALDSVDTFAIGTFGGHLLSRGILPATDDYLDRAAELVRSLPPNEGEGMQAGLQAMLSLPHQEGRLRVLLIVSDGYFDDPFQTILPLITSNPATRVFSLCTGTAANRLLLEAIAVEGRGGISYLRPGSTPGDVVGGLLFGLSHPALTDISIEMKGCADVQLMPRHIPDLFAGRPVTLVARCTPSSHASVIVTATGPHGPWSREQPIPMPSPSNPAIAAVWARRQLSNLIRHALADTSAGIEATVRAHALEHGLLSPYTSFLTIDTGG